MSAPSATRARVEAVAGGETLKAAGLALATLIANGLAAVFTVVFFRLLGADGYGSLAALLSTFLILGVPGTALQVAVAREAAAGRLGDAGRLVATIRAWTRLLLLVVGGLAVLGALGRGVLADAIRVEEQWAAAATLPTAGLWLLLCVQRGALQGLGTFGAVGWSIVFEAAGRLVFGIAFVGLGSEVTGAYLGTPVSMLAVAIVLECLLLRRGHAPVAPAQRLRHVVRGAWAPLSALFLLAVLQNIDVVMVKRAIGGAEAGAYAAAAVASKAIVWVAIGVALYLVPEASRRADRGEDARGVLARVLAVVGAIAAPTLLVFAFVPALVLRIAFGDDVLVAESALLVLGGAMTLLAATYLCAQFLLALHRTGFLVALGLAAAAEVTVLAVASPSGIAEFARIVLVLQAAALAVMLVPLWRARPPRARRAAPPTTAEFARLPA